MSEGTKQSPQEKQESVEVTVKSKDGTRRTLHVHLFDVGTAVLTNKKPEKTDS